LSSLRPNEVFPVLSNPEFLAEGSAVKNLLHPDRVLIGAQDTIQGRIAATKLSELYQAWVPKNKIITSNIYSSELSKLVANAMLAQRISSMNGISALCEKVNADVREVSRNVGTDARIGSKFLNAGPGFGGSCFRKDVSSLVYICESLNLPEVADYWRCVLTMNTFQRHRISEKIISKLNNTLSGKKITLLGFAYKKDTGDTRESPAVDVIRALLPERPFEIAVFDPCCPKAGIEQEISGFEHADRVKIYSDPYEACRGASTITILTEWDFFRAESTKRTVPLLHTTPKPVTMPILLPDAPLERYLPSPLKQCPPGCLHCNSTDTSQSYVELNQRLDWALVSKNMKHPRYVLDSRSILEEGTMRSLGVELDGLGWGLRQEATSF
jgi:UDPglucose 6-dehydrogenase